MTITQVSTICDRCGQTIEPPLRAIKVEVHVPQTFRDRAFDVHLDFCQKCAFKYEQELKEYKENWI